MSLDRDIASLGAVEILSELSSDQLRLLAFGAEQLDFRAGRPLYREGQIADCGFVILSGEVALSRRIGADDVELRTIGQNSILGEMALITQTNRLTTAMAVQDTQTLRINRNLFRRMLDEYPETAVSLHAKLSNRLAQFLNDIGRLEHRFTGTL